MPFTKRRISLQRMVPSESAMRMSIPQRLVT